MSARALALVAVLAMLPGGVGSPRPAHADATGCSFSSPGTSTNCIHVESDGGSGADITFVRVSRLKASGDPPYADTICEYHMEVEVRTSAGVLIDHLVGPTSSGCAPAAAAQNFTPNRTYPDRSRICGFVFEGATRTPGHPCQTVLADAQDRANPCSVLLTADQRAGTNTAEIYQDCEAYEPII